MTTLIGLAIRRRGAGQPKSSGELLEADSKVAESVGILRLRPDSAARNPYSAQDDIAERVGISRRCHDGIHEVPTQAKTGLEWATIATQHHPKAGQPEP